MIKHPAKVVLEVSVIFVFGCATVWAQATAQIGGTISDQSGAVLPGVEVTATQTATGIARSVLSNEAGSYTLPNLPTGPYRLEAALPGFQTYSRTGIVLEVNSNAVINASLQVGNVAEKIEVIAGAALVETRNVGVGQLMENQRILELPLNGRNVTELITLSGAATQTGTSSTRSIPGQQAIAVAGGLDSGVAYQLDGAMHNNPYDNLSLPLPFPDVLQEFKVETSALSAAQGRHSGAQVNAVTKSGTNELHGDVFWFVRNDDFNAREYFSSKESTLKRNQFGGTIGGPILRNKLFFFGGYQGTTLRSDPANLESFVPTAAMLRGDFTALASPACNGGQQIQLRDPRTSQPFPNNQIDPSRFSPAALAVSKRLPTPLDECGRVTTGIRTADDSGQVVAKVDYQIGQDLSLFGRSVINYNTTDVPHTFDTGNLLNTTTPGFDNMVQAHTFGSTYLFNPTTVNSFRLAVNRSAIHRLGASYFQPSDVGVKAYSYLPDHTIIAVTGGFSIGSGVGNEARFPTTTYQVGDDVSLVRGAHQISVGGNLAHWRSYSTANVRSSPNFSFSGQQTLRGLSDFLIGGLSQIQQAAPNQLDMRQWYLGLYGADTWKATQRLTLNYGLRWEPYLPQTIENGQIYNFSEERFQQGIKSTAIPAAPAGFYFPGDPGFPGNRGHEKKWGTLGPRLGLAWDPQGDGKTSVRASYSIAYDFVNAQFHLNTSSTVPPWAPEIRILNPAGGLDDPYKDFPGGNPFPWVFDPANPRFTAFAPFLSVPFEMDAMTIQSWNLSVQRQFGNDLLVSAVYMGNQMTHLWLTRPLNPADPTVPGASIANTDRRRKLYLENPTEGQYMGFLDAYESSGTGNYNGLLLNVTRRTAGGLTFNGNYTWSHCIGDRRTGGTTVNANTTYVFINDRRADRGNCDSDRRHNVTLTGVAAMPQFANTTLRRMATGWRLSGIYRYSTGSYMTVTAGSDRALNGTATSGQRAVQILEDPFGDNRSGNPRSRYLNPAAFALPALGTLSSLGTSNIEGPGRWDFDLMLSRTFQFGERQRFEIRTEAFNVLNSFRPENPVTNIASSRFGLLDRSRDPRILQFAAKWAF